MTLKKGPATELIHAGKANLGDIVPLTTPIYETATFVFENAEEVLAFNEGRSSKYLYSRYANPTIVSVEQTLAALGKVLLIPLGALRRRQREHAGASGHP